MLRKKELAGDFWRTESKLFYSSRWRWRWGLNNRWTFVFSLHEKSCGFYISLSEERLPLLQHHAKIVLILNHCT